jgi:hypothetical protein
MQKLEIVYCLELSSDHTPIIVTMHTSITETQQTPMLCNKCTDWDAFRELLDERIDTKIPLKSKLNIEEGIQQAAWQATPPLRSQHVTDSCPSYIKYKLTDKRKARRRWQTTRAPEAKHTYNKLAKDLKHLLLLHKNAGIQQYLEKLTPHKDTNYSLWETTRKLKQPRHHIPPLRLQNNTWARTDEQKTTTFAHHLSTVFHPFPSQPTTEDKDHIMQELCSPYQMALPLKKFV